MFFSPLIQNQVNKRSDISKEEKNFVKWFIKFWYINIIILFTSILAQIFFYLTNIILLQTISFITAIILAILLVIWSVYAISNKEIIKTKNETKIIKKEEKFNMILSYIPIYNIYLRYKKHNFDSPDLILKESIILWSIFILLFLIFQNININSVIIIIIIIRLITLFNNIDRPENIKNKINNLFKKNPEEIRWYVVWIIVSIFNNKNIIENIKDKKTEYELIFKIEYKQILLEYIILFILSLYLIYFSYTKDNLSLIIPILFIISRYTIMLVKWNHLPHLPIIKEVTNLFFKNKNKKWD